VVTHGSPARPQTMRALNELLLLEHIRVADGISRADLSRISGLAKNTVSLALANLERAGLIHASGVRTGLPGPAAILYEMRPESGFVLALDIGGEYLRGAIADIAGTVRARTSVHARATDGAGRVAELHALARSLLTAADLSASDITQTVLGSPGVYDPRRDTLSLAGGLAGWEEPTVLVALREAFGDDLMIENDIDAAALAERAHGHGRAVDSFAFVSIGTGIGMGLVLGGRLHRGAHGAAGEIGYMPLGDGDGDDEEDARRRGRLEACGAANGIVRAAHRAGLTGVTTARDLFAAADAGDEAAARVVAAEALLIARAICSVITVVDPDLIVLGGGVGQAAGFATAVGRELDRIAPVHPDLKASALGVDAVVDGCLAAGHERAWQRLTAIDTATVDA
jgi:predicted NBD/HSP70 family sugar kinase